jgi:hypothetical protein
VGEGVERCLRGAWPRPSQAEPTAFSARVPCATHLSAYTHSLNSPLRRSPPLAATRALLTPGRRASMSHSPTLLSLCPPRLSENPLPLQHQLITQHTYPRHSIFKPLRYKQALDGARVEHDADRVAERLGGQVDAELGPDHARVAVRAGHLAPDDAHLRAPNRALGRVDVRKALITHRKRE